MALAVFNSATFVTTAGLAVGANATVEVRRESDSGLAAIFADLAGTTPITNPSAFADSSGRFKFYAAPIEGGYSILVTKGAESYTLRDVLIGDHAANAVFLQSGTGAVARTMQAKARDVVHVKDFGWIGDGASHPLQDGYSTLGAAQAIYPHALSLTDELDWAAAQAAINRFTNGRVATASGAIDFDGVGLSNRPLWYGGANGHVIHLRGRSGNAANGSAVGTAIKWNGTAGVSMLIVSGANKSTVDGINLDGTTGSGLTNCIHITADNVVNTTLSGSIAAGNGVVATPAAMTNIAVGMCLAIDAGGTPFELVYVTAIDATTFTANFLKAHASGVQVGGSDPSSGVEIAHLGCGVPAGAASNGILFGNKTASATLQVSEFVADHVMLAGAGASGSAYAGISVITGGNVKNGLYIDCAFIGFKRALNLAGGSGTHRAIRPVFANTTEVDIVHNAGGTLFVDAFEAESETGHMLLSGSSLSAALIEASSWECSTGSDDWMIDYQGSLVLIANRFLNSRTASSIPKVRNVGLLGDTNNRNSIYSVGNFYQHATEQSAVFYQSENAFRYEGYAASTFPRLFSFNDTGGDEGGTLIPLTPIIGPTSVPSAGLDVEGCEAGLSYGAIGRISQTYQKVTIPYTKFQIASTQKDMKVFDAPAGTKVVGCIADTTIAFAGPAGTLNLLVGTQPTGNDLILSHDVKTAAVTKGLADVDLGAGLANATAVQGGIIRDWTGATGIHVRLLSGAGNLSELTAGSVTIKVAVERML